MLSIIEIDETYEGFKGLKIEPGVKGYMVCWYDLPVTFCKTKEDSYLYILYNFQSPSKETH